MKYLSDTVGDIFGKITPPTTLGTNPQADLAKTIGKGVNLFLTVAALFTLGYMLWGALDWIISSGEKERVAKAQNKITNAVVGLMVIIVCLTLFGIITGDILGIIVNVPGRGWGFNLPTLQ